MYSNRSGSRPGEKNAQQDTEAVSGNWRETGSVLFPAMISAKSADPGHHSGNRGGYDFLLRERDCREIRLFQSV